MTPIEFFAPGIPKPGGSKRAIYNHKIKRAFVVEDCAGNADWRNAVAFFAGQVYTDEPLRVPLSVEFEFIFQRPQFHYGSGKNAGVVKASAPPYPSGRPDATKLVRSTEDALTGLIWADDALIVVQHASKRYGERPGAWVRVRVMSDVMHHAYVAPDKSIVSVNHARGYRVDDVPLFAGAGHG